MKLSVIFEDKPDRWGYRGDPYFWDYLGKKAENMDLMSPEELENWIKKEHLDLSGVELSASSTGIVEEFSHGGMSSGGLAGDWWVETGIPLLQERLTELNSGKDDGEGK